MRLAWSMRNDTDVYVSREDATAVDHGDLRVATDLHGVHRLGRCTRLLRHLMAGVRENKTSAIPS